MRHSAFPQCAQCGMAPLSLNPRAGGPAVLTQLHSPPSIVAQNADAFQQHAERRAGLRGGRQQLPDVEHSLTVLFVVATVVLCAALVVVVLKCKKKREGKRRENLELEMRQTPSGPTGLGHLRGSIKDESQLTYTAEPGFEDFDYDPTKEGAGEDYKY